VMESFAAIEFARWNPAAVVQVARRGASCRVCIFSSVPPAASGSRSPAARCGQAHRDRPCLEGAVGRDATGQAITVSTWDTEDHARWSAAEAPGDLPSRLQALGVQVDPPQIFEVTTA
jgi:hypothetical protein